MKLSAIEENYIKEIYKLQNESDRVSTNALATSITTTAASVSDMLQKLKTKKLLDYKKYYGFRLNANGQKIALKIIRKHRLWEYFLVAKLGMQWEKIHDVAEELEHISSDELIERLDEYLGRPTLDPHGDPIPNAKGQMTVLSQIPIAQLKKNKKATVSSVGNQSIKMLEMLNYLGLQIGDTLMVVKTFDLDGSLLIKTGKKKECLISGAAAKNIFVYDN